MFSYGCCHKTYEYQCRTNQIDERKAFGAHPIKENGGGNGHAEAERRDECRRQQHRLQPYPVGEHCAHQAVECEEAEHVPFGQHNVSRPV